MSKAQKYTLRNMLLVVGTALAYLGVYATSLVFSVVGFSMILLGCYYWTQVKNRHWILTLWGILAPIGFLPLAILKDKSNETT